MFTGLIEDVGRVRHLRRSAGGARCAIETALADLAVGESIAVNGACQTVAEIEAGCFSCDVLPETLRVTNLGALRPGSLVNLERAMRPGDRLGGHIVNGHVDGVGTIVAISSRPGRLEISAPPELGRYLVAKGPVAVDGASLTIGPEIRNNRFEVFIIPHTWEHTAFRLARVGGKVNIEVDILAKYVERLAPRGGARP